MFRLLKGLKTDSKEVAGARRMRGRNGMLCFSKKEVKSGKDHCVYFRSL